MRTSHGAFTLVLIVVALAAVVGHSCALPADVHAVASSGAHDFDPQRSAPDHDQPGDGHAGTCAALRPGTTTTVMVPAVVLTPLVPGIPAHAAQALRPVEVPAATASPPLYLTHRALLI